MLKNRGKVLGDRGRIRGRRENLEKKNANLTYAIPKLGLSRKFHPNRIMGKCSKKREN